MKKDKKVITKNLVITIIEQETETNSNNTQDDFIECYGKYSNDSNEYLDDSIYDEEYSPSLVNSFILNSSVNDIDDIIFNDVKQLDDRIYDIIDKIHDKIYIVDENNPNCYVDYFIKMFKYFISINFKKECIQTYNKKHYLVALLVNLCEYDGIEYEFLYSKLPPKIKNIIDDELKYFIGENKYENLKSDNILGNNVIINKIYDI